MRKILSIPFYPRTDQVKPEKCLQIQTIFGMADPTLHDGIELRSPVEEELQEIIALEVASKWNEFEMKEIFEIK